MRRKAQNGPCSQWAPADTTVATAEKYTRDEKMSGDPGRQCDIKGRN